MKKYLLLFFAVCVSSNVFANYDHITQKIKHIEKEHKIKLGVSAVHIESGKFFHHRQDESFKLASTIKFPIAIYLLDQVRKGKISLQKMVRIEPYDLVLGSGVMGYYLTYPSLMISIHNLLEPMMAISCNTSADVILKHIGGIKAVSAYIKSKGFKNIDLTHNHADLYYLTSGITELPPKEERTLSKWKDFLKKQPVEQRRKAAKKYYANKEDTTSPRDMSNLLIDLFNGSLLGEEYSNLLLENMTRCTEKERIVKHLPASVKVAHKTGSWWHKNGAGHNVAMFSDIGIIYLPKNKGHIALSIYSTSDKNAKRDTHLGNIAKVAKLIFNEFSK